MHCGKSFKFITPLGILSGQIDIDGFIINEVDNTAYTVIINIPVAVSSYLINQDQIAAFKQLKFQGDRVFGREFLELLVNLNFSGLYTSESVAVLFIQQQLQQFFIGLKNTLQLITTNTVNSVTEYLLYESEDLITQYELKQFCDEVDSINERTNLLIAKFEYIQK
jgi:ubiquinone biosynthesis protein UbiJ